jgi:hypothetical protein
MPRYKMRFACIRGCNHEPRDDWIQGDPARNIAVSEL